MTNEPVPQCPGAPAGESHRWRIPNQGSGGPGVCKWCGQQRAFTPDVNATQYGTWSERGAQPPSGLTKLPSRNPRSQ